MRRNHEIKRKGKQRQYTEEERMNITADKQKVNHAQFHPQFRAAYLRGRRVRESGIRVSAKLIKSFYLEMYQVEGPHLLRDDPTHCGAKRRMPRIACPQ